MDRGRRCGDGGINPDESAPRKQGRHAKTNRAAFPFSPYTDAYDEDVRKATLKGDFPQLRTMYRADQFGGDVPQADIGKHEDITEDVGVRPRNPLDEKYHSKYDSEHDEGSEDP